VHGVNGVLRKITATVRKVKSLSDKIYCSQTALNVLQQSGSSASCTLLIYQLQIFGSVHRCRGGRKYNNDVAKRGDHNQRKTIFSGEYGVRQMRLHQCMSLLHRKYEQCWVHRHGHIRVANQSIRGSNENSGTGSPLSFQAMLALFPWELLPNRE
jgi:hypothetical protein